LGETRSTEFYRRLKRGSVMPSVKAIAALVRCGDRFFNICVQLGGSRVAWLLTMFFETHRYSGRPICGANLRIVMGRSQWRAFRFRNKSRACNSTEPVNFWGLSYRRNERLRRYKVLHNLNYRTFSVSIWKWPDARRFPDDTRRAPQPKRGLRARFSRVESMRTSWQKTAPTRTE
jgi:hypothetical protein